MSTVAAVLDYVGARTGLAFPPTRLRETTDGVARAARAAGARDPADYLARLQATPSLLDDLYAELTVGETYFFREPAYLDVVAREVVPDVRRRRGDDALVRAWSAGCATGEEPYSLGIGLRERTGARHAVLGTDLSRARLRLAARGEYGRWSLRGLPPADVGRWFEARGECWRLRPEWRRGVSFRYLNLLEDVYPSAATGVWGMDVVLCRNVLIYLGADAVRAVARRLLESLAEGGWLFLGASDPLISRCVRCEAIVTPGGMAYRRGGDRVQVALPARTAPAAEPVRPAPPRPPLPPPAAAPAHQARPDPGAATRRVRALANQGRIGDAIEACVEALAEHRDTAELAYLHGVLLTQTGEPAAAVAALRRALYLAPDLAVAHLALGDAARRCGELRTAQRAFRTAAELLGTGDPAQPAPAADGEPAGRLLAIARAQLELLEPDTSDAA